MTFHDGLFWVSAAVSVPSALLVVTRRNPVYAAVSLLVCFLGLAGLYVSLSAPFLAALHIIVYTGAILVLFLFVIMLLNLRGEELGREYPRSVKALIALVCFGFFAGTIYIFLQIPDLGWASPHPENFGEVKDIGRSLFKDFLLQFELVGVLLLVAMIGAMVLAKRRQ